MTLPKTGRWLLGGLAGVLLAGLPATARAQVTLKISVQEIRLKQKPTAKDMKDPKSMLRNMDKKVIDERTLRLSYGTPKELLLPNGNRMRLTALSYNASTKMLKMHIRTQVKDSGYDSEVSMHDNSGFPANAGVYDKHLLMVWMTPQVD